MKYFALISLLFLGFSYARTIETSMNDLVTRFDMPELLSISDEKELYWFVDRYHITDPVFFYSALMSELMNPKSFPQSRQLIAKYGLRKYLITFGAEENLVDRSAFITCISTLVKGGNFSVLFELVIKFESKMIVLLDLIAVSSMKQLTEALLACSERQQFLDVISRHNVVTGFIAHLFGQLILSDAPESFYIDHITSNEKLLLASVITATSEYEMKVPIDVAGINKISGFINAISYSEQNQPIVNVLNDGIRIITSPDNVTMADLAINISEYDMSKKFAFMLNAGNHGKDVLLREALATLSIQEIIAFANYIFASSKQIKKLGLKFGVKLYSMLPECVTGALHESESYLQAAVEWLRLDSVEELPNERNYSHKLTFKADPEQIADGLFQEMVYYHRRQNIFTESNYALDLKFTSAESVANFLSHDLRNIFPQLSNSNFPTSKDTLNLLAENENLRFLFVQSQLKLLVCVRYLDEYMKECSIENIPNVGNLIRDNFINIEILSLVTGSDNFAKIEKFTDKCIVEIVNQALAALMRPAAQAEYTKIRNVLVYLINGPKSHRLNELPNPIKLFITQEFPCMASQLTFS